MLEITPFLDTLLPTRYQHLDVYLPTGAPFASAPDPNAPNAAGKGFKAPPATGSAAAAAAAAAVGTTAALREAALQSKQWQLPAIDFGGEREAQQRRRPAPGGSDVGGGRGGAKPPRSSSSPPPRPRPSSSSSSDKGVVVVSPATDEPTGGTVGGSGGGGDPEEKQGGESGEETTSIDGEEDFLALPVEFVQQHNSGGDGSSCGGGGVPADPEVRRAFRGRTWWVVQTNAAHSPEVLLVRVSFFRPSPGYLYRCVPSLFSAASGIILYGYRFLRSFPQV